MNDECYLTKKAIQDAFFVVDLAISQIVLWYANVFRVRTEVVDAALCTHLNFALGEGPHGWGGWARALVVIILLGLLAIAVMQAAYLFIEALSCLLL